MISLIASNLAVKAIAFVQATLLTRYLGPQEYGVWRTAYSIPTLLAVLLELGIHSYVLREIARDRSQMPRYFASLLGAKLLLSVAFIVSVFATLMSLSYSPVIVHLSLAIAIGLVFMSFIEFLIALFRGVQSFRFESIVSVVVQLALLAMVAVGTAMKVRPVTIAWGLCIAQAVVCCVTYAYAIPRLNLPISTPRWALALEGLRIARKSLSFLVLGLVAPIFYEMSTILLSKLSSFEEVGTFNAAYRIVYVPIMVIPVALNTILFPILSKRAVGSREELALIVSRLFLHSCLAALPFVILMDSFAGPLIVTLLGDRFVGAAPSLRILSYAVFLNIVRTAFMVALNAANNEGKGVIVLCIATAVNVVGSAVLIPRHGALGACFAVLIAEGVRLFGSWWYCGQALRLPRCSWSVARCALAGSVMFLLLHLLRDVSSILGLFVSTISYGLLVLALGLVSVGELKRLVHE